MVIAQVLNNNVAIIKDEDGVEKVVCGKGIAFKKKPGDEINPEAINKVFVIQDKIQKEHFRQLVAEIPIEQLQLSSDIIEMIKSKLGKKLNDSIYITLSDHIYTAIQRFNEGIVIRNSMLWDIKRFYETEFQLGEKALVMIKERMNVELPEDEAASIAIHIVNAEMDESSLDQTMKITKIMQEISNIVKYYFSIEFDTDNVYYYRFITHLKFFAQRLVQNKTYEDTDGDLLDIVKMKYVTAYNCVEKIAEFIQKKYDYTLSDEEKLYLTIHVERVVSKNGK